MRVSTNIGLANSVGKQRTLGTPSEEQWPGVTSYPDFKASFPQWERDLRQSLATNLDQAGLEMLEMMLVYDPAGRMSAKQACNHPYFEGDMVDLPPSGYHATRV